MKKQGRDVLLVPMYLPLFADEAGLDGGAPIFFGAVNTYLAEKFLFYKKVPQFVKKVLDSKIILDWASKKAGSTRAAEMGDMTVSMIRGTGGRHEEEVENMITWLLKNEKPDIVHLSNAMLTGLAARMKERLKIPVVCSLQDENAWIDELPDTHRSEAWNVITANAEHVDVFISVSKFYRDYIIRETGIPPDKIEVIPLGIDFNRFKVAAPPVPPAVGFVSRLNPALGLDTVVDAFLILRGRIPGLQFKAMGGMTGDDDVFIRGQEEKIKKAGAISDVEIIKTFDRFDLPEFMNSISVISVPVPGGEAFGTYQIEAMAAGVPVVQPRVGAATEIVEKTGGGVLYEANDTPSLVNVLGEILSNEKERVRLGREGREAAQNLYTIQRMARQTAELYERYL